MDITTHPYDKEGGIVCEKLHGPLSVISGGEIITISGIDEIVLTPLWNKERPSFHIHTMKAYICAIDCPRAW